MLSNRYGTRMMLQQVENCLKLDLVKKEKFEEAQAVFYGSGVNVTQEGKRYLGASLGPKAFTENFVSEKVLEWTKEI